jgi:single-strand DNA-binding protein
MNDIQVILRGNVASEPRHVRFDDGGTVTSFRFASTSRRFDPERQRWVNRDTTYVDVNCRKAMASNAAASVRKGHPLVVTGRLRERFWSSNGRSGQTMVIEADTVGHDLTYGTTEFVRIVQSERGQEAQDPEAAGGPITDVSSLVVLDDEPERDEDPDGVAAVAALLPDSAVA